MERVVFVEPVPLTPFVGCKGSSDGVGSSPSRGSVELKGALVSVLQRSSRTYQPYNKHAVELLFPFPGSELLYSREAK